MFLKDNNYKKDISEKDAATINGIANKTIKEILKENDNLFVFSNNQKDKIEDQTIFNLNSDRTIVTNNIVGFISVNGLKINIGSRFSDEISKQYLIQYMLQKVYNLNLFDLKTSHDNANIWEQLLYIIFPIFLKRAYHQGIFKIYRKRTYNDSSLKGRIDIARQIKQNIPFEGKFAYNNKEFSYNNPLTHLIRHTIEYISAKGFSRVFYNDYIIASAVQMIKNVTPDYSIRDRYKLVLKNYKRITHPYFTEYEPLRKLCIQILNRDGMSFGDSSNKVYGLLIDIAWLWEEYLNTILNNLAFKHPENRTGKNKLHLFSNSKSIFPDFYNIEKSIVIDAKYKMLQDKGKLNRDDLYQVITYMYRLKSNYGILLYPSNNDSYEEFEMHKESYGSNNAKFIKYGVHIPEETEEYSDYINRFYTLEKELEKYINSIPAHYVFSKS